MNAWVSRRSSPCPRSPLIAPIGGELQPLVTFGLGADVQAHIAQGTRHLERVDHRHQFVRQWRQGVDQRRQRCQVEPVSLHLPAFLGWALPRTLSQLQVRLPTRLAKRHGQRVDSDVKALVLSLEPGRQRQVVHGDGLAPGLYTSVAPGLGCGAAVQAHRQGLAVGQRGAQINALA
ncbi:hypothetical protein WR25_25658 [Diploscapter pachys]|uniref:Uncharacterized protein n=1 Tax=Diploscapter pachys TaxID=2018661 RepID=A0A2A2K241_9BILA|nr:hypothetical protein WR25_25658 [Diploscapter pachys]